MSKQRSTVAWISAALLRWFRTAARPMAWRETRDPYRIWVSEIMLQQTRVETVAPYYDRFLLKFPDVETLARAPLDAVLKAWEGLGYY
ncbi:MAG: A/G-specific adenine glycosylase, partial [Candidatus Deferrimicrobiaceae bacterium]